MVAIICANKATKLTSLMIATIAIVGVMMSSTIPLDIITYASAEASEDGNVEGQSQCTHDKECIPAGCCHSNSCVYVGSPSVPNCTDIACTLQCAPGTMDCGQGWCSCVNGECVAEFAAESEVPSSIPVVVPVDPSTGETKPTQISELPADCAADNDCVPSACCGASKCVPKSEAPNCAAVSCVAECRPGTMDCGQGHCICEKGGCRAMIAIPVPTEEDDDGATTLPVGSEPTFTEFVESPKPSETQRVTQTLNGASGRAISARGILVVMVITAALGLFR